MKRSESKRLTSKTLTNEVKQKIIDLIPENPRSYRCSSRPSFHAGYDYQPWEWVPFMFVLKLVGPNGSYYEREIPLVGKPLVTHMRGGSVSLVTFRSVFDEQSNSSVVRPHMRFSIQIDEEKKREIIQEAIEAQK